MFAEYWQKIYLDVNYVIDIVPGISHHRSEILWRVLCDVDLSFAQSSSKRLSIFVSTASNIISESSGDHENIKKELSSLVEAIGREVQKDRWCHFGLYNVTKWFGQLEGEVDSIKKIEKLFGSVKEYQENLLECYQSSNFHIYKQEWAKKIKKVKTIFVFSKSQTVIHALYGLNLHKKNEKVKIVVLEGSPRSRYDKRGRLIFSDGVSYAKEILKRGFENIKIIPDIAFGSLLKEEINEHGKDKVLVAIGANGININDKSCHHALGHILVLDYAKNNGAKSILFAEDLKISDREKGLTYISERDDAWFYSQSGIDLENLPNGILANPREDKFDLDSIDFIITERGNIKDELLGLEKKPFIPDLKWILEEKWKDALKIVSAH